MHITADMKMADLIHLDFQLLAVIQRMDIPMGFKEKTVEEVCMENKVDTNFFIEITNSFHDSDYLPKEKFFDFKPEWLVSFLRRTHECILEHKIPEIKNKIDELVNDLKEKQKNYELIKNFFKEYIGEITTHMKLEEKIVFPYVLALSKCLNTNDFCPEFDEFKNYSIQKYIEDHNDIEEQLYDLKNILIKYLPLPTESCKYNSLLFELFRLEKDLKDHSKLEDKVLIPRVRIMETELENLK